MFLIGYRKFLNTINNILLSMSYINQILLCYIFNDFRSKAGVNVIEIW